MMQRFLGRALGLSLAVPAVACGQDLGHKAPPQDRPVAIVGATVHPVDAPAIEGGYVVFDGGLITAVGAGDPGDLPAQARVINADGLHVYPGLIACDTQLGLEEITSLRPSTDHRELGEFKPEVFAAVSVNPDSTLLPVTRSNGILTIGVEPTGGRVPGRASVMSMDGWTWEDMSVEADAGLVINWPSSRPSRRFGRGGGGDRSQEQLDELDAFFDGAAVYFERRDSGQDQAPDIRYEGLRSIWEGAEAQRPVFIHAEDVDSIAASVAWALARGFKPVIVGGQDAPLCAQVLLTHDVPVILSGVHRFPKRDDSPHDEAYTLPMRLEQLGIRWCLAPSDRTANTRNLPYEAATAVAYGLDEDAAVRGITLSSAEILGVGDRLGSITPGKLATIIVTDGTPLETRTNVRMAFIGGREIDLGNKQTDLAEKYREKYRQLDGEGDE